MSTGTSRRPRPPAGDRLAASRRWLTATLTDGVTSPAAPRPARLRLGRADMVFVADLVFALVCWGATNSWLATQDTRHGSPLSNETVLAVSAAVCAPLVLRTRFPFTAWWTSAVAMLWAEVLIPPRTLTAGAYIPAGALIYGLCLYAVAVRCRGWVVAAAALVTLVGAIVIDLRTAAAAILAAIPLLAGVVVRVRRSGREQLAVQERRHVGERALLEERQRIARELHDIVAHHMSVIAIQAEAGPYKTADPPAELVESFREIRASALSGLGELRRLLGVLRSDGADIAPQPGLADLEGLLASARSGGVTVTATVTGTPQPIPEGVDLSAYRITQEALSNAMRHAPGSAVQLHLGYTGSGLTIEVRNDGCPPAAGAAAQQPSPGAARPGPGHGIVGMRERAAMLGGHLSAAPVNGGFLVTAYLPLTGDLDTAAR